MSRYIRPKQPGATVFFTVALVDRGSNILVRHVDVLRQAVRITRNKRPFRIEAWVVLPDHMHCVWTLPEGDSDFSTRMGAIKAQFTRDVRRSGFTPTQPPRNDYGANAGRVRHGGPYEARVGVNPDLRGEAPIWQKRFWEHHIRDEADFRAHVRYCWINPVKHGLVESPGDWPYSSFHRDGGGAVLVGGVHPADVGWSGGWRGEPRPTGCYSVSTFAIQIVLIKNSCDLLTFCKDPNLIIQVVVGQEVKITALPNNR